jgi:uncharacterized membrane protein YtjA (UPF0391 family)
MLRYAFVFVLIALAASTLLVIGLVSSIALIAKALLLIFAVLFVVSMIAGRRGMARLPARAARYRH